ncbi:MAG: UvrD-helicase domain-containing protein [Spirochaetia bacterium]|jgi:ATP-dependent exoDNAse (exonuclease V) beta subunit
MSVLEPDSSIQLPSLTVLKASAGSGKTRALTARYVQFLLSPRVPKNGLRNILAITFSNNASREMKENVLLWLKSLHLRRPERIREIESVTSGGQSEIVRKAGETVQRILREYSDFQVRTIDSFMSTVFRASAIELGFAPDFQIMMDPAPLLDYAFDLFLRDARPGSRAAELLDQTVAAIVAQKGGADGFPWEPASLLRSELLEMEKQTSMLEADPVVDDLSPAAANLEQRILESLAEVERLVEGSGLEESPRSSLRRALRSARAGMFADIPRLGMGASPVKKPQEKDAAGRAAWEGISAAWAQTRALAGEYAGIIARGFYAPYLCLHAELFSTLERAKRTRGAVFISDVNRKLLSCLSQDMVPDIYFRMGERVFHYLVDEFQDTSPIQWKNLFPLIENSLAQGGSLFVVGDTKQAIYGFRHADYTIMRSMERENPFPSVRQHTTLSMQTNYRSRPRILRLNEQVFRENAALLPQYRDAARQSGLDDWRQDANDAGSQGRVEVEMLVRDDENPPERGRLHAIIEGARRRGYRWGDIAVLASRNEEIIRATSWLNEKGIPFISYSSLDVRRRKVAGEMLGLLTFLDSPKDDLAFVTFILGDIFAACLAGAPGSPTLQGLHRFLLQYRDRRPLYKAFQQAHPEAWDRYFAGLFRSAGYLPLYDLASEICAVFQVFERKPDEEATLAKLLEAIKDFEGRGSNSLRDFLHFAGSLEGGAWDINVPDGADSVTAMTIHKAKGLGFPVVIALLYGERSRGLRFTVIRENGQIKLVKLSRQLARHDEQLSSLYDGELLRDKVNKLNGLYVALTRAREEMYVVGVKRKRDSFPFDVLPEPFAHTDGQQEAPGARPVEGGRGTDAESPPLALSHAARPVPPSIGARRLTQAERRRGDMVHAALSQIRYASSDLEADIRSALGRTARAMRLDLDQPDLAKAAALLIRKAPLAELFSPGPERSVFTEWELCDEQGKLFRLDRVVVDRDRVTVIDWKTGEEEDQADGHEEQVANYARIVRTIYPEREVRALLAYLDRGETRSVD